MVDEKKKKGGLWLLLLFPLFLGLLGAAIIFARTTGVPGSAPHHVRVAVKDSTDDTTDKPTASKDSPESQTPVEETVDKLWLEAMDPTYLEPHEQNLKLDVPDLTEPPEITPPPPITPMPKLKPGQTLPPYEEEGLKPEIQILEPSEPAPKKDERPKIAIVIDDVGLSVKRGEQTIALPAAVTLSFLPYAPQLQEQADHAKAVGHDVMLHMPMEPMGKEDPGPGALLTSLSVKENHDRFLSALHSFKGFVGVNNHMGSKFTSNPEQMRAILETLKKQKGVFFMDSVTTSHSVAGRLAREMGVPTIARDIFLDDEINETGIKIQLERTEEVARQKGYAVAIGHPHNLTLTLLNEWTQQIQGRGFVLVPVRELIFPKEAAKDNAPKEEKPAEEKSSKEKPNKEKPDEEIIEEHELPAINIPSTDGAQNG